MCVCVSVSVFVHGMFCQAIDTFVAFKLLSYKAQNGGKCQQTTTTRAATTTRTPATTTTAATTKAITLCRKRQKTSKRATAEVS